MPPSGSLWHLHPPLFISFIFKNLMLIQFDSGFSTTTSFFPLLLSPSLAVVKLPEYCRWAKPLRNGKQLRRVGKHWCAYRWCRANRQESLHCSTLIAAIPLGLSALGICTDGNTQTDTHTLVEIKSYVGNRYMKICQYMYKGTHRK